MTTTHFGPFMSTCPRQAHALCTLTLPRLPRKFRAVSAPRGRDRGEVFSRFAGGSPMDERDTRDPLRDLEERLDKARRGRDRPASGTPSESGVGDARAALSFGFRLGLGLGGARAGGVSLGWGVAPVAR